MSKTHDALTNYTNGFKEGYDMGFKAGFEEASKLLPKTELKIDEFSALCSVCGRDFTKGEVFGWMCYNQNCPNKEESSFSFTGNSMIG